MSKSTVDLSVVIFGATGMVGRGALMEALASPAIKRVIVVTRRSTQVEHQKLEEILHDDFEDLSPIASQIGAVNACFWCLGTSAVGMDEAAYTRITHTFTMAAASVLENLNPEMTFCFVSGHGADGSAMWARVKKRTEDDLRSFEFPRLVVLRPAFIRADHDAQPRGPLYRVAYTAMNVVFPMMRAVGGATSNSEIGRAMIVAARDQIASTVISSSEINELSERH